MTRGGIPVAPGTSFVGRERELAALAGAIQEHRLLTLHGPGGAGKTRIALELVDQGSLAAQALFADLAPLARGSPVWPSVVELVGAREEPGIAPDDAVVRALAGRELLLVLDNCEHVLDAAREVARRLLDDCAGLTLLATSREPLGLPAETVWPVPPLSEQDAARLFAERAARALPGFAPREEDAPAVERICRRLDGIPLAIELAAARVKVLGPEELAERLDDRFRLLAREDPVRPPRQRTLRALVDWSFELLSPAEVLLMARLSVFAGGFELDAVESICSGDGPEAGEMVDLLADLVDKALVARGERAGHARFRLHETIGEYARERLAEEDDPDGLAARHLDWCRAFAARADDAWLGEGGTAWLDRARAEQDNVRQALRWGLDAGRAGEALEVAWRYVNFWSHWGRAEEGGAWLERCLEATAGAPPSVDRARALTRAGEMARFQGHLGRAREWYEGALATGVELGDPVRHGVALLGLADVYRDEGLLGEARRLAEQGLSVVRTTGDRTRISWLIEALGRIDLAEGDVEAARERFEASRAEAVALGNEITLPLITRELGETEREAGDRTAARMHLEEALGLAMRTGDSEAEAAALLSLGLLELGGDAVDEARARLTAALRSAEDSGARRTALQCIDGIARVKAETGEAEEGARLLGAASAMREMLGTPPEPRALPWLERLADTLSVALGPEPFAAALGAGRAWSWPEAVEHALREAPAGAALRGEPIEVVLRRRGDMWALSRPGRDSLLRDSKGIRYLAALIAAPGREVHVLELAGGGVEEPGTEVLDETARSVYRRRLSELEEELDEAQRFADPERMARLAEEREALVAELAGAVGLGGRARRTPSSVERARKAVTNRIRDTLARIERDDPELGAHLRRSMTMGAECSYRPEPRSPWSLSVA